ncbi:TetR/AcrR family transcriptional regulator [Dactylosporangium fulvum]|uniref:TetR/AcrR family transcriptional regulator n=1 Tax=Dactylosporangium fulvum TaxID=53359 RepID=A0ABY5WAM7_9ACTN|nr:TetR/AcrR family transcriptional regulator [Dactylosporangium fulvum]UWP87115.1 TetR/AcrR family transcriptional regulator [Dactylosporangium fulvum]
MVRLTRAEAQERTHERLLATGRAVFLRRGFLAATVEEIAAEAGYTRGAVYKHFGSKEGLWQAIVDAVAGVRLAALRDAFDRAGSRAELLAALDPGAFARDDEAARWTLTSAEYLAAVAAQPAHAAALAALQRRLDGELAALLTRHCRRLGIRPAMPVPQLVVALGAFGGGLALLAATDPATDAAGVSAGLLDVLLPEARTR